MRAAAASAVCLFAVCFMTASRTPLANGAEVHIQMMNVRLHADEGVVLDVEHLDGLMVSRSRAAPVFDDQRSYFCRLIQPGCR